MGKMMFTTIDSENVNAILAMRFEDFGLGRRLALWKPLAWGGDIYD